MEYYILTFTSADRTYFLDSWGYKLTKAEREAKTVTAYYRSEVNVSPGFSVTKSGLTGLRTPAFNAAFQQFKGKVDDHSLMLANLAELGDTFDSVSDTAFRVGSACGNFTSAVLALKKGKIAQAKRHFKQGRKALGVSNLKEFNDTAAGAILAVNWALRPVTNDVTKALSSATERKTGWRKITARGSSGVLLTSKNGTVTDIRNLRVAYRFGCEIRVVNPTLRKLRDTGLINPLQTAWELVPFSFVIDWFVNVGDHISALGMFTGLEVRNGFTSRLETVDHQYYDSYYRTSLQGTSVEKYRDTGHPTAPMWCFSPPDGSLLRSLNQLAFCVTQMKAFRSSIYSS